MPATRPAAFRSVACAEERLGGAQLRLRRLGARRGGQRLQVGVGGCQHDEIASALVRVLRGGDVVVLGLRAR